MRDGSKGAAAALFGAAPHIAVDRALAELRAGRPVVLEASGGDILALPVEGLDDGRLAAFQALCAPGQPRLLISARRARALGLAASTARTIAVPADMSADAVLALAAGRPIGAPAGVEPAGPAAEAAIALLKLSHGLPAALIAAFDTAGRADTSEFIRVPTDAVAAYQRFLVDSLAIASEARVPLAGSGDSRFVIFRDGAGGNAVAVVVGEPDLSQPVAVRLHSACLTGDVFGSRRCDCGDQLRLALDQLEADGGVILYLPQEGRSLGIVNKMRAYSLQDAGLDTIDANTQLGFDEDERDYGAGARMLQLLGIRRVWLMTNNPEKLAGIAEAGIEVVGRMPLETPAHADNRRYLATKATRAGHQLDHFVASLAEATEAE